MTRGWLVLLIGIPLAAALVHPAGSQASTKNVTANVTFNPQIAIAASADLAAGINVQNLTPGSSANNGSKNYNPADNNTTYYISADAANSLNLDLCVNASGNLSTAGGDTIPLAGNYSFNDSALNTSLFSTYPGRDFNTSPGKKANTTSIAPGGRAYFRFFLNVPDNQPAGTYTNTISFRARVAGAACA